MATQNQLNAEYNKELNRLKRFMRQAQKKGFAFPDTAIPKPPKKITAKSVSRLQKITSKSLYKKATYTIPETGQVVSGLKGKEIISKAKRPKAPKTKAPKSKVKTPRTPNISSATFEEQVEKTKTLKVPKTKAKTPRTPKISSATFEKQTAEEREQEKQTNIPPIEEQKEIPKRSNVVLSNFLDMFIRWTPLSRWSDWYVEHRRKYKDLGYNVILAIIDQLGEDVVAKNLEEHAEEVAFVAEHLLYGSGEDEQFDEDINRLATYLQGKPLSFEQSINATELAEQQGLTSALAKNMDIDFIL